MTHHEIANLIRASNQQRREIMDIMAEIGQALILDTMRQRGWSMRRLGRQIGRSAAALHHIIRGNRIMPPDMFVAIIELPKEPITPKGASPQWKDIQWQP